MGPAHLEYAGFVFVISMPFLALYWVFIFRRARAIDFGRTEMVIHNPGGDLVVLLTQVAEVNNWRGIYTIRYEFDGEIKTTLFLPKLSEGTLGMETPESVKRFKQYVYESKLRAKRVEE